MSVCRWQILHTNWFLVLKDALAKPVQAAAPMRRIMTVAVYMPHMFDIVGLKELVNVLTDANQSIFIATGDPQQFQFGFSCFDIGDQFFDRLGIGCGREGAHPSERIEVAQSKVERLTATHRQTSNRTLLAILSTEYLDSIAGIKSSNKSRSNVAKDPAAAMYCLRHDHSFERGHWA